jgi:hypothetical protein
MIPKRAYGLKNARRCLIDAEDCNKSVHSEQFKLDLLKVFAAEDMIRRCANKGVFYKDPDWNCKKNEWTYFIEGSWWKISFTVTDKGDVILKSICNSTLYPEVTAAPPSDPKCLHIEEEAIQLLRLAQEDYKVSYTNHCFERLLERGFCEADVRACIATGVPFKKPEWKADIMGWTYSIEGAGLRLFFSFEFGGAILITLYVPDPNYRRAISPLDISDNF